VFAYQDLASRIKISQIAHFSAFSHEKRTLHMGNQKDGYSQLMHVIQGWNFI
jgi:hypothetical protein